ncbi:MFS transporter [Streptomyces sp. NPDC004838]
MRLHGTSVPGRLWALTATHAANDFYTGAVAALLPYFVLEERYDYAAAAGIMLAATSLSSVAQPLFGYLSDRFRMSWLSLAGLLTAGAGVAVSGLVSSSYALVCAAVAVSGIGVAAYHPPATVAAKTAGGGTNRSMSVFSVGGNAGVALAPGAVVLIVGTYGLDATWLLFLPALVLGAVQLAADRRAARTAADRRPRDRPLPAAAGSAGAAGDTAAPGAEQPAVARRADDWAGFARLTGVLLFWSVAYVGTSSFVSLHSIETFGAAPGTASIALSVFPAAGAAGTLVGGWLADRHGRPRVVRTGYGLAALAMLLIALAPAPAVVIAATALLGTALFLPFAPQITLAHSYLPNRLGMASGVTLGLALSLGGLVVPLLGGLADRSGVPAVFALLTGLLALAFALTFTLREPRLEPSPAPSPEPLPGPDHGPDPEPGRGGEPGRPATLPTSGAQP